MFKAEKTKLQKVLEAVFMEGSLHIYGIEKKTGLSHATVHKIIRKALNAGLLEIAEQKRFRTGLMSKAFKLTKKGYEYLFQKIEFEDQHFQMLEKLAKEDPSMHPAFKYFEIFTSGSPQLRRFYLKFIPHYLVFFDAIFYLLGGISEKHITTIYCLSNKEDEAATVLNQLNFSDAELKQLKNEIVELLKQNELFREDFSDNLMFRKFIYKLLLESIENVEKQIGISKQLDEDFLKEMLNLPSWKGVSIEELKEFLKKMGIKEFSRV
ncbi:MAG: helix-turn-helix domain-containing protein [Candidatus Bathyarchaeia archaeon]